MSYDLDCSFQCPNDLPSEVHGSSFAWEYRDKDDPNTHHAMFAIDCQGVVYSVTPQNVQCQLHTTGMEIPPPETAPIPGLPVAPNLLYSSMPLLMILIIGGMKMKAKRISND